MATPKRAKDECFVCSIKYDAKGKEFCNEKCFKDWIESRAPCLVNVPIGTNKYNDICNQFMKSWKHLDKQAPSIYKIWKIYCNNSLNVQYNSYKTKIEKKRRLKGKPFRDRIMSIGNEQRRFHGTKTNCQIGIKGKICNDKQCSVCSIIKEGYKLKYTKYAKYTNNKYERFGCGIYFSATSSKSDDYNGDSLINHHGSNLKTMILNKVVVGKTYTLITDNQSLNKPPHGYDSILGEPSYNGDLNYDEVVVYNEAASIPQYLVAYRVY